MSYSYSELLPTSKVRASGCFTTMPVRFSTFDDDAVAASKKMEKDWEEAFEEPPYSLGCQNVNGHLTTVSLPECLPERVGIVSYIMDYMLHHDGKFAHLADLKISRAKTTHLELSEALDSEVAEDRIVSGRKEAFQGSMLNWLTSIDDEDAKCLLKVWKQYMILSAEGMDMQFPTLKEYLPYRMKEAGVPLFLAILKYCMSIKITEEEEKSVDHIIRPVSMSMALVNDYFSWDKEYEEYLMKGEDGRLYSAIKLISDEHRIGVDEAKGMVRAMILSFENEYTRQKETWLTQGKHSEDLIRYVEFAGIMAGGSMYWHSSAPRYHQFVRKHTQARQRLLDELYRPLPIVHEMNGRQNAVASAV